MFKISSLKYIPVMMLILTTTGYADFQFIFNDHTYQVITTSSSWEAASAAARSKTVDGVQGYLAHIDNLQENTAIFDQLMANISSNDFGNTSAGFEVVVQHMFGLVQMIYQLKEHGFG